MLITTLLIAINLTFTWTPADTLADNFKLYLKKDGQATYTQLAVTANKENTLSVEVPFTGVIKNCFTVTAFNKIGESAPSNEVCLGKPVSPTNVIVQVN